jgi:outer membrane protein assembly factor BamB
MLTIAPLWLMLAAANTSAYAQTSHDVSNSSTTTSTASSPADWTQFHRDNMQRWNPNETVLGVVNVGSLTLKWKNPTGVGGFSPGLQSSLAVVNGVVYFSSDAGNVYALNASTGATLWSSFGAGNGSSSPAVVDGVVYISSLDNNVYALNASTGAKLWSYAVGGEVDSSPAVANGVVYFGSHTFPDNTGKLYALNANTGAKLWSYATEGPIASSPAVANGVVYFGSDASDLDHNLYALNASTGAKLWSYATGTSVFSSPAVANGVVYFGSGDDNVYALNASTGAKLWSYDTGRSVDSSPAVANGVVYISDDNSVMYALNASTGAKLWSYGTGGGPAGFSYLAMPSPVNGVVYVHANGNVYAFSVGADLFLRIRPTLTTVHQGDLLTYAFPVWNLGPNNAVHEVLNTQVPAGTVFDYIRISGTPGLGTCTRPPYLGTGPIVCHENSAMAPNTTWTVRLTVKVTAPAGTVITESAATMADSLDPNLANNTATVSIKVQ